MIPAQPLSAATARLGVSMCVLTSVADRVKTPYVCVLVIPYWATTTDLVGSQTRSTGSSSASEAFVS